MDKKPDRDKAISEAELESYLDGDSPVSAAYRELGGENPPANLDRAILEEARHAAQPPVKGLLARDLAFWRHWARPVTALVIAGFCLSVVLEVMQFTNVTPLGVNGDMAEGALISGDAAATSGSQAPAAARAPAGESMEMIAAEPARMRAKSAASDSPQEIVVGARKSELQQLREPLSTEEALEEVIIAGPAEERIRLAPDAAQAWQEGARPAASVWLVGIEMLISDDELKTAISEIEKMRLIYPDEADQFAAARLTNQATEKLHADENVYAFDAALPAQSDFADPYVWLAGIESLASQGKTELAAQERLKLKAIYPGFLN